LFHALDPCGAHRVSIWALSGWTGGPAGIGVLNALADEYRRPEIDEAVGLEGVGAGAGFVVGVEVVVVGVGVGPTTPNASETAAPDPFLFVAVTTRRSVEPTSLPLNVYVEPTAPAIAEHSPPALLQRSHWLVYVAEGPLQSPASAVTA
jgi:hypothetical protein